MRVPRESRGLSCLPCPHDAYPLTVKSNSAHVKHLSLLLEKREFVLPRADLWPAGIEEFGAFEYSVTDNGSVRTSAPSGMDDDCVIALAARNVWPKPRLSTEIGVPIVFYADGTTSSHWW